MTLALIAALPSEINPLVRGWQRLPGTQPPVWAGRIGSVDAIAIAAGMGGAAATRACESVLAYGAGDAFGPITALVSIGYAGSLSCGLQVGHAYVIREVIDAASRQRFAADPLTADSPDQPRGQRLISIDRVADAQEKRALAAQHQAVLVDMEAAAVARFACAHHLRFHAFKAITDGPNDKLPDFNRFITSDGRIRTAALTAWAALHPASWNALGRLGRNSRRAAHQLAALIPRCLGQGQ
jgi:adenosylhomocysteine nucleosidase